LTPVPGDVGVPNGAVLSKKERRETREEAEKWFEGEVRMSSGEKRLREKLGTLREGMVVG